MATETERAWLAGLFDGEGHVGLHCQNHRGLKGAWVLRAKVSNTHAPTLQRALEIAGVGRIYAETRGRIRPCFELVTESKSAEVLLEMIQPYSVTKREQIRIGLAAVAIRRADTHRSRVGVRYGRALPMKEETHAVLRAHSDEIKALNHGKVTV